MNITAEQDARIFLASWDAVGGVRPGILSAVIAGQRMVLAIMNGAPTRYSAEMRDDQRAALDVLQTYAAAR